MKLSGFQFNLPARCVAAEPSEQRDQARLLCLSRGGSALVHRQFSNLPDLLRPGDLLVLNNSAVFKARLKGKKSTGGAAEILFLHGLQNGGPGQVYRALVRASNGLPEGMVLQTALEGELTVQRDCGAGMYDLCWRGNTALAEQLKVHGEVPLPPYIVGARKAGAKNTVNDEARYQTVFAKTADSTPLADLGSVAAPTAGLHFTPELLEQIRLRGVEIAEVTLHVGPGTFLPIRTDTIEEHVMPPERYWIEPRVAERVNKAKREKRRVVAVGTTAVRTLESAWTADGLAAGAGETKLFIYPGYTFGVVDAMVTNFHLPGSTLLLLVSAFAGWPRIRAAYLLAIREGYRFYSYGDAMVLE